MKSFLFLLLIAALGIGGYIYWPQIQARIDGPGASAPSPAPPVVETGTLPIPENPVPDPAAPVVEPAKPTKSELVAELEKAMARNEEEPDETGEEPLPQFTDELAAKFPMPKIKPLEEAVGNWKNIPKGAFPRTVTLEKDITLSLPGGIGKSTAKAGTTVSAIAANSSGVLAVAPNETSKVRGLVGIDDTDFKAVVTEFYEEWVQRKRQEVFAKRSAERRKLLAAELARRGGATSGFDKVGSKPVQDEDGRIPVMVRSIQNKDVTEFDLKMIKSWSPVLFDEIDGEPYWTATVNYDAETIFGTFDAEAMALIQGDKVVKWIYAGSGEPVP